MNCQICGEKMRKVRWEITNNYKVGKDFKEFDKYTYECKDDDFWVTTESPIGPASTKKPKLARKPTRNSDNLTVISPSTE